MSQRLDSPLFPVLIKVGRAVQRYHGKYIDATGRVVIEGPFDWVDWFFEGRACVRSGRRFGFVDSSGSWAIQPTLLGPTRFREGLTKVGRYGQFGFMDRAGEIRIQPHYALVDNFHEGRAWVSNRNRAWGVIDTEGNSIVDMAFENAGSFASGLAPVCVKGKWGFIDRSGDMRIEPRYDWASLGGHREGLAAVQQDSRLGFINTDGEMVIAPKYVKTTGFQEGLAWVQDEAGRSLVIDIEGRVVFETEATFVHPFCSGLSLARKDSKIGYLDRTGRWAIEPHFGTASSFRDGLAFTGNAEIDRLAYIDTEGNTIWQGPSVAYSLEIFTPYC